MIEHTHSPISQGSGFPIEYVGTVAMSVNLLGFAGPLKISGTPGAAGVVTDIVHNINHHGTSQLIIGLKKRAPFSVTLLQEPTRLVIDILREPGQQRSSRWATRRWKRNEGSPGHPTSS